MTATLAIEGELTIYRAEELKAVLAEAIGRAPALALDLSGVTEFDGAGLQLLLAARKHAPALTVAHASPAVIEVLELLDLARHFRNDA